MSKKTGLRAAVADAAESSGMTVNAKQLRAFETAITRAMVVAMVGEGFTMRMACDALGVPAPTVKSWKARDPEFAQQLEAATEVNRKWLLGMARQHIEYTSEAGGLGGKAAGRALGILANLYFPELRESKVTAEVSQVPQPDVTRGKILSMVTRGE